MNCTYCDKTPSQKVFTKNRNSFVYNGLDRINSSLPHYKNNVVPCCYTCNKMKNDRSLSELDLWLSNIKNNWITKNV